ncbi:hypothetical protein GCM10009867_32750 [Pedococcus aerophilus]|uniref:Uncharacterized protein n=1 Tax=Pedococcus aerophilus TaxID=436356 RepID=A0ABP6HAH6_9MICO
MLGEHGLEGRGQGRQSGGAGHGLVHRDDLCTAVAHHQVARRHVPVRWQDPGLGVGHRALRVTGRDRWDGGTTRYGGRVLRAPADQEGSPERHHCCSRHERARNGDANHAGRTLSVWLGHQSSPLAWP